MIIIHLKIDAKKGMHSSCMPNKELPKQRKMQQKNNYAHDRLETRIFFFF